ncbi:MAG TPA: hypothetical protein VKF82_02605 [Candidatus Eremiobacteraceae bacterium]|nr:hypothetical protein [Candidatus Eremiobacteraceae bacterium]
MKMTLGAICMFACLLCTGCGVRPTAVAATAAPPIAGTLYIMHPSDHPDGRLNIEVRHDGLVVQRPTLAGELVARDRPSVHVSRQAMFSGVRRCEPLAISPHGVYVACLKADGNGTVAVFKLDQPAATLRDTRVHISVDTHEMAGFVSDSRLALAGDDQTCPMYYRTDAHVYSAEPRARLFIVDSSSAKTIRPGVCLHGLVAGDGMIAYIGHDSSEEPQYSLDGTHWSPGLAVAVDGGGDVLAIGANNDLADSRNRVIAHDVVDAVWTR